MAVILGNYNENKMLVCVKNNTAHNVKLTTIKELVSNMDGLVQLANDIYDTYIYIRKDDDKFAKQLWHLLCRNRANGIEINSYFAWSAKIGGYAYISRYGASIYNSSIQGTLKKHFGFTEQELYSGKALLLDYLDNCDVEDRILDKIIEELQVLIASFETYAKDFFNSVSAYKVKKID